MIRKTTGNQSTDVDGEDIQPRMTRMGTDQVAPVRNPSVSSVQSVVNAFLHPCGGIFLRRIAVCFAALFLTSAISASAATSNGNEFALAYSEAKTFAAQKAVMDDAQGRPHFFRYLLIMEMEPAKEDGRDGVRITAFEPSSYLDVKFTVTMPVSLGVLREDPASKVGDAIASGGSVLHSEILCTKHCFTSVIQITSVLDWETDTYR